MSQTKIIAAMRDARTYILEHGSDKNMAPVIERLDRAIKAADKPKRKPAHKRVKTHKAWADVGSHGGIFAFEPGGRVGDRYPNLLHIFTKQHTPDLVPVTITAGH